MRSAFLIVSLLSGFFLFSLTSAQATTVISPVQEFRIDPGTSQEGLLKLFNETDRQLVLEVQLERLATDNQNQAELNAPGADNFIDWIEISFPSVTLEPNEVGLVPYTVSVPSDATPGGYYATAFWQEVGSTAGQDAFALNSRVGTQLLLTVTGEMDYQMQVVEFSTPQKVWSTFPVNFTVRLSNTGNVHVYPVGTLRISNWLGELERLTVNPQERTILPNSQRQLQFLWGEATTSNAWQQFLAGVRQEINWLPFGKHTVQLDLQYGPSQADAINQTITFTFIPYRSMSLLAGIIIFFMLFFMANRRIKKLKRSDATAR